ncbi:signal peptide peptidase SppA [Candidatus Zixiibacteriota bacterium]
MSYRKLIIGTGILFLVAILLSVTWSSRGGGRAGGDRFDLGWSAGIGLVEITGFIGSSEGTVRLIEEYGSRSSIRALLVKIESPGGVTVDSDEIYRALQRVRVKEGKPIVAYLGSVAASGGYYIACAADTIIAHPASTTGSIGVIIEYPVAEDLLDKVGVRFEVVTTGPYKSMGSPFEEPTEEHREWFQALVDDTYEQFIDVVRAGRMLDDGILSQYADGRVFTGRQAVEWGFADWTGDFHDARLTAARMGGLGEDAELIRPRRTSSATVWDLLLGRAGIREIREGLGLRPLEGPRTLYLMR